MDDDCTGPVWCFRSGRLPPSNLASKVEVIASKAMVTREVDGGFEIVQVGLLAFVTNDLRLGDPRCVTLLNIIKVKKKPLEEVAPAEPGVDVVPR